MNEKIIEPFASEAKKIQYFKKINTSVLPITREEFEALKKEVEELKKLIDKKDK